MNRAIILLSILPCLFGQLSGQSTVGITGQPDTSYTLQSAWQQTLKSHPEIQLVQKQVDTEVKETNNVCYLNRKDRSLMLDVFEPKTPATTKKTAIVIIHGGGWRSGNKNMHHALAQALAKRGYVCFTPAYRLSTEALFPAAVHDLRAAIAWVRDHADNFNVDTSFIVALGHSAGGELAAFLGTNNFSYAFIDTDFPRLNAQVNAFIDMDGILAFIHPESGEGDDSKRTSAATYWFGYGKNENRQLWYQASPLTHVGKETAPALFINSSVKRMQAGQQDCIEMLKQYGIYHDVINFPDAPHSFCFFEPWFTPMLTGIQNFLQHLGTFNQPSAK